jgi:hypothetical protein
MKSELLAARARSLRQLAIQQASEG